MWSAFWDIVFVCVKKRDVCFSIISECMSVLLLFVFGACIDCCDMGS